MGGAASRPASSAATKRAPSASEAADSEAVTKLTEELTSLKLTIVELEKERDFYFGKLRDVEITCQTHERTEVSSPRLPPVCILLFDDAAFASERVA